MYGMGTVGYVWKGNVRICVKWNTEQHKQTKNIVSVGGKLSFIIFLNPINIVYQKAVTLLTSGEGRRRIRAQTRYHRTGKYITSDVSGTKRSSL